MVYKNCKKNIHRDVKVVRTDKEKSLLSGRQAVGNNKNNSNSDLSLDDNVDVDDADNDEDKQDDQWIKFNIKTLEVCNLFFYTYNNDLFHFFIIFNINNNIHFLLLFRK